MTEALKWIVMVPMLLCIGLPSVVLGALYEFAAAHFVVGRKFMASTLVKRR